MFFILFLMAQENEKNSLEKDAYGREIVSNDENQLCVSYNDGGDTVLVPLLEPVDYHPSNDQGFVEEFFF